MGIGSIIASATGGLLKPAADAYAKHSDRKLAKESASAKLAQTKQNGELAIDLTKLEIEQLAKANEKGSWKDEFALVLGTSPFIMIMVGAILAAFGHPEFAVGVADGLAQLGQLGVPMGDIVFMSIMAGLGIRLVRK